MVWVFRVNVIGRQRRVDRLNVNIHGMNIYWMNFHRMNINGMHVHGMHVNGMHVDRHRLHFNARTSESNERDERCGRFGTGRCRKRAYRARDAKGKGYDA
jgi:hypothetical protein